MIYADDHENSLAAATWAARVTSYLTAQEGIEPLRSLVQPNAPWPESDNPMLSYLIARSIKTMDKDGPETALLWVAVHSWSESAIDTRADLIRHLGA